MSIHVPISNFKTTQERPSNSQLVSASEKFIAYIVGRKKVRLLEQATGQKGMVEAQKDAEGSIVSVALKGHLLASLTEAGELVVGSVFAESKDSLGFEPIASLTFPDLKPSRGITWSGTGRNVLALHGKTPAVFVVWIESAPAATELPHSLQNDIEAVCFFGEGKYIAVADKEMVECYEIDHPSQSFSKIAQLSFGSQMDCQRVALYEDIQSDFVIAAFSENKFSVCPVKIGHSFSWISSGVSVPAGAVEKVSLVFDPLLQTFILDSRTGQFTILSLRSAKFAVASGSWKDAGAVHSMVLCPGMRDVEKNILLPVYTYQAEWVSFYGLSNKTVGPPAAPSGNAATLVAAPVAAPTMAPAVPKKAVKALKETAAPKEVPSKETAAPKEAPSKETPAAKEEEIQKIVKAIMLTQLVPSIEAAFNSMFKQVQAQLETLGAPNDLKALEKKLDGLIALVAGLKSKVEGLPSAEQIVLAISPMASPLGSKEPSMDDLVKRALVESLASDAPSVTLVKGLELGNLGLLVWLLGQLDPETALESVAEPVLLSLSQQLGSDLDMDTELKLDWLAEIFTTFNPKAASKDAKFAEAAGEVLEDLFASLRVLFAQLPADSDLYKKAKLVMRLVRMAL